MRFDILTLHPNLLKNPFEHSILHRAINKKIVEIKIHDINSYKKINIKKLMINLAEAQEWL